MDPLEMLFAHRYEEFAAYCKSEFERNPDESGWMADHARALQCMGKLEEALSEYEQANALHCEKLNAESQPYLANIGALQWLVGRREDAIVTFRAAVDGILDGSITFADIAGGVSQGLLLWYAGVTAGRAEVTDYALKYLRNRSGRKPWIEQWPGPLGIYVLGESSEEDVLVKGTGHARLKDAIRHAKTDLLARRQLVQTLFYFAVRKRRDGFEEECRVGMVKCASLENPIIEVEWYLACAEAGRGNKP